MKILKDILVNGTAYAIATTGTIIGQVKGWHALEYACKPLMLIILSSWFFFNSRRVGDRFTLLVQAALFFSLVGDVVLMFEHHDAFMFLVGLAAFLLAHLCYTIAFAINVFEIGGSEGAIVIGALSIALFVFGGLFLLEVLGSPNVDQSLYFPVSLYALTITTMGVFAALRFRKTYSRSFWLVFAGAVLFIISDALLANGKFNLRPFDPGPIAVMVTYAASQFMMATGCLMQVLDPEMIRRRNALSA